LPFPPASFDLVMTRHVLWTLPHPEAAIDEWKRVLRPGGRLAVIDSQFDPTGGLPSAQNARASSEYAAIGDKLPFLGGRPCAEIEALFKAHGYANVGSDLLSDLVEAQLQRMTEEGLEPKRRTRYIVWGEIGR
jgi:ubiquinone/menaquinone biosynthesis C-methylase UbiE